MITIIDYGSGNIKAIQNIYKQLNVSCVISKSPSDILSASKLVLPGVGAFDETMLQLQSAGIIDALNEAVIHKKVPIMGVCVGMQIMASRSDEGSLPGLGWVDAEVKKFPLEYISGKPKLPHMGWNSVVLVKQSSLLDNVDCQKGFYFLHSYYFSCLESDDVIATTTYGKDFTSVISKGNIYGVQFHPEKSHSNGMTVFKNFSEL